MKSIEKFINEHVKLYQTNSQGEPVSLRVVDQIFINGLRHGYASALSEIIEAEYNGTLDLDCIRNMVKEDNKRFLIATEDLKQKVLKGKPCDENQSM
jgi:hypothetical protein